MSAVLGARRQVAAGIAVPALLAAACGRGGGDPATRDDGGRGMAGAASVRVEGDLAAGPRFEIAPVALTEVWVDPEHGDDARDGVSEDWCAYVKGGSAFLTVEGNEFADCGTGGFTAGQGTGFQFMEPPWLTYEASDIRVVNNIVHDVDGAAFGVAGASDTLIAYNTAYRIGARSHLIEVVLGRRGCDGAPEDADAVAACRAQLERGGWGTTGAELEIIPNRDVWFYDNVLVNPSDFSVPDVHFQVHGCVDARTSETNIPGPACAADGLVLVGNVILNGDADVALFDEVAGCAAAGSSCAAARLRRDNSINVAGLALLDPEAGYYCVGRVPVGVSAVAIPDFPRDGAGVRPSAASAAPLSNAVTTTLRGEPRPAQGGRPGAC